MLDVGLIYTWGSGEEVRSKLAKMQANKSHHECATKHAGQVDSETHLCSVAALVFVSFLVE